MADFKSPIQEVTYLTVPGVSRYRTIMRKMFLENENMHIQLYKEEILSLVKEEDDFKEYSIDDLKQDLEQLVLWNNLVAIQDPGIVHTIAEYKNKQYRYSLSNKSIEIERLTIELENLNVESSSLSTNYFSRIEDALKDMESVQKQSLQDINDWWHMFQEDFQRLNKNYKDYLRDFYTADTKTLLESMEFIIHKDKFIQYLNNFIKNMQLQSRKIKTRIEKVNTLFEETMICKIAESELEIPSLGKKKKEKKELEESILNKWISFKRWFVSIDGQKTECEKILDITSEIIRSVIENANTISQLAGYGVSRKEDYKQFIQMFMNCRDINEAHCLSAHVFGVQNIEHFKVENINENEDIKISAFDIEENYVELESHARTYREKRAKEGVLDKTMDKRMALWEHQEMVKRKESLLMKYIQDDKLIISNIKDKIPMDLRVTILSWISQANMMTSKSIDTEIGRKFRLYKEEGTCILHCEDGDITMPNYVLVFEK